MNFFIKRLVYSLLVILGVVTVIFIIFNVLPGDPARMVMGQRADEEALEIVRKDLGLNQPTGLQYLKYINDLSPLSIHHTKENDHFFFLDTLQYMPFVPVFSIQEKYLFILKKPYLRRSYQSKKKVSEILAEAFPNTFILALVSIFVASIVGIFVGIISAIKKDTFTDRFFIFISSFGMSLPSFFAAIIIGWLFAYVLADYTNLNLTGNLYEIDDFGEGETLMFKNLILPAFTLSIRPLAVFIQLSRNSMLDVLSQDYIRTAWAKGTSFYHVITRHALKNALNPVITSISGWFASLMAGVVFVEYIFGWKGLGFVIVNALNNFDLPLIMGCVILISLLFIIINLMVDVIYTFLDPRVKLS